METLDWGQITPEGANLETNTFLYVFNHDITSADKVDRTIRFIVGRLLYYDNHLPKNASHKIRIDIRGQQIDNEVCDIISQKIKIKYLKESLLEIEFIRR